MPQTKPKHVGVAGKILGIGMPLFKRPRSLAECVC